MSGQELIEMLNEKLGEPTGTIPRLTLNTGKAVSLTWWVVTVEDAKRVAGDVLDSDAHSSMMRMGWGMVDISVSRDLVEAVS